MDAMEASKGAARTLLQTDDASSTDTGETGFIVTVLVVVFVTFVVYFLLKNTIMLVRHAEVMIIERLGKYHTTLKPGLHFVWPLIDKPRLINWRYLDAKRNSAHVDVVSVQTNRIDMREHVIDFGRQHVITKDTVQILIDALVFFRITDPRVAVFQIQNLPDAVELLTQSTLRNIIAQMTLDDTFSSREQINAELLGKIQRDAERWGVSITRVEIFNINPPDDIKAAMENQIQAERTRRSTVLRADGERESSVIRSRGTAAKTVLEAEGFRGSELLRAKGQAEAKTHLATAEAKCIECISAVCEAGVRAVDYLTAIEYLNSLKAIASRRGDGDEVVLVPADTVDGIRTLTAMNDHLSSRK